jgi:hypothetical protein
MNEPILPEVRKHAQRHHGHLVTEQYIGNVPLLSSRLDRAYCSRACRQQAYRQRRGM